jgi:SOS response associated peptidase (SRAP)
MGSRSVLVVETAQRIEAGDVQRAGRDSRRKAVLPGSVQTQSLPDPCIGLLRWEDTPDGKQPWYSPALTIAGLWDEWHDKANGETLKSCTTIITKPDEFVAEVHDRMPVLLDEKDFEPWLSGEVGLELLRPASNDHVAAMAGIKARE